MEKKNITMDEESFIEWLKLYHSIHSMKYKVFHGINIPKELDIHDIIKSYYDLKTQIEIFKNILKMPRQERIKHPVYKEVFDNILKESIELRKRLNKVGIPITNQQELSQIGVDKYIERKRPIGVPKYVKYKIIPLDKEINEVLYPKLGKREVLSAYMLWLSDLHEIYCANGINEIKSFLKLQQLSI